MNMSKQKQQAQELINSPYIVPGCKVFGIIYCFVNMVNNKVYVGQHVGNSKSIWTRWYRDLRGGNPHFASAVEMYGIEMFRGEILAYCYSQEELDNIETLWIITLCTYNPEYGYNMTYGGEHGTLTQEVRDLISIRLITLKRRSNLRVCYNCFHPFDAGSKYNREGIFCSKKCELNTYPKKEKSIGLRQAWNKGRTNIEIYGEEKAAELLSKNPLKDNSIRYSRLGEHHTPEARKKLSLAKLGKPGSRLGMHNSIKTNKLLSDLWIDKVWITNEKESKRIDKALSLPEGFRFGLTKKKRARESYKTGRTLEERERKEKEEVLIALEYAFMYA